MSSIDEKKISMSNYHKNKAFEQAMWWGGVGT